MVIIDGLDSAGKVIIRDPWRPGTKYTMDWEDFIQHWMGDTIWWGGP